MSPSELGKNMSTWHGGAGWSWWTERHQPGPGKENLIAHCSEQTFPCYLIHGSASSAMVGCHLAPCRAHWQLFCSSCLFHSSPVLFLCRTGFPVDSSEAGPGPARPDVACPSLANAALCNRQMKCLRSVGRSGAGHGTFFGFSCCWF